MLATGIMLALKNSELLRPQAVREKAAVQAMELQREREQLMAELGKFKGKTGTSSRSRLPLGSIENARA